MQTQDPNVLLERLQGALSAAASVFSNFDRQHVVELKKAGGDPVTEADLALDDAIRETLLSDGEGWLSEETADNLERLDSDLVWIVDPLDGTREFIDGLPEFCTSIAAVAGGRPVAGGILNPAADLEILGAQGVGVTCNGQAAEPRPVRSIDELRVLASRSEVTRGQWSVVQSDGIEVEPMGSVAYKLARVAAGLDDLTWTPVPKHEWDVAAGAALMTASGGRTLGLEGAPLVFNQPNPWLSGMIALPPGFETHLDTIRAFIERQVST